MEIHSTRHDIYVLFSNYAYLKKRKLKLHCNRKDILFLQKAEQVGRR